ncbi:V-type ATP synthase subunit F [Clostridium algidicarnis]|uniref:V/A-type H+-transporting ATPase subunit F n=2 Tax=Clostridium algidicarnis TaxID=37659 RepID=A0A2S6FXW6_9CLOT|nr:V-type ATP synthase subunit F [Clostridium algidicarnis]MBB6630146.1 ATP synthase subunit F [Clostridium algidicarnis]MBU3194664.1 V-type ATP synthase subunit F [Clostridium algidicarnis]MBU3203365.1 V-type ATP synthase subunit F [Clostridium algidicarnis]MBU3206312.1 V-type ATP synthase subunit F [Clostridium algidicarnis]MBU3211519.1 V-type ATP synthase subunit F [Clostridium algidicarnis]
MKSFLISDNVDTIVGMKMAGIDGIVLNSKQEILDKITELKNDKEIGIIIITEKIGLLIQDEVNKLKVSKEGPLLAEIPDRHGSIKGNDAIVKYIKESIGLKI